MHVSKYKEVDPTQMELFKSTSIADGDLAVEAIAPSKFALLADIHLASRNGFSSLIGSTKTSSHNITDLPPREGSNEVYK
ncbi:hypothetical protein ACJX0J_023538, partial [Zea mays]